jgi:hypothetical protein
VNQGHGNPCMPACEGAVHTDSIISLETFSLSSLFELTMPLKSNHDSKSSRLLKTAGSRKFSKLQSSARLFCSGVPAHETLLVCQGLTVRPSTFRQKALKGQADSVHSTREGFPANSATTVQEQSKNNVIVIVSQCARRSSRPPACWHMPTRSHSQQAASKYAASRQDLCKEGVPVRRSLLSAEIFLSSCTRRQLLFFRRWPSSTTRYL